MAAVLVIDDDANVRDTLIELFVAFGHEVTGAENGLQGLHMFERSNFHVAVVDVDMPTMTGVQFAREVRNRRADLPIILFTGYSHLYKPQEVLGLNIDAFLRKPLNLKELLAIVNRVVENHRQEPGTSLALR